MTQFTGTLALLRLNLRLDRVRLLVWTLAVGVGVWSSIVALDEAFPTQESLQSRAALLTSPATIMMTGPAFAIDDYTFGAMVANELALYLFIAAAIMAVMLSVRHTRAEEESGRLELIRARHVGRFAPAAAAFATVAIACLLVGAATAAGLIAGGLESADSVAFGLATALVGLVFAGIAAVFAQFTEHARSATGMGMAAIAVAFLVRGVGDVIDNQGSWLSWFSPLAWAQQTRLYVDLRWWPLGVSLGAAIVLLALATAFARRRDLGAGLRQPKPGRPAANRRLLTPAGLAARLLSGGALAWSLGTFFFAVAMGSVANELETMLDENPALAEWIAIEGTDLTAEFAGVIVSFVLIAPLALGVAGILRLTSEEASGRLEQMLVSGLPRVRFVGSWLFAVVAEVVLVTAVCGIGVGIGVGLGTSESSWLWELTLAALAFLPAILVTAAFGFALYGLLPRLAGLAWALVVWIALVLFLGELLGLPDQAMAVSPFHHTPALPGQDFEAAPLLVMGGIAVVLVVVGLLGFRRRDVVSR